MTSSFNLLTTNWPVIPSLPVKQSKLSVYLEDGFSGASLYQQRAQADYGK